MPRSKAEMNLVELQDEINKIEAERLFNSPSQLNFALSEREWAKERGFTAAMIYTRIREANVDPNNPVITMRTKPGRRPNGTSRGEGASSRRVPSSSSSQVLNASFSGWDLLVNAFQARGVEVTDLRSVMTAEFKSHDENRAVLLAWGDLRRVLGCACPKKQVSDGGPIQEGQEGAQEVVEGGEVTRSFDEVEQSLEDTTPITSEILEVVETGADGRVLETSSGSSAATIDPPSELSDSLVRGLQLLEETNLSQEPTVEAPAIEDVKSVPVSARPVHPSILRPQPVRSSLPPRPQPVSIQKVVAPTKMS